MRPFVVAIAAAVVAACGSAADQDVTAPTSAPSVVTVTDAPVTTADTARPPSTALPATSVDVGDVVTVELGHCGVDPVAFDGEHWETVDSPFGETNADEAEGADEFVGRGHVERLSETQLRYTDESGVVLTFERIEQPYPVCS